MKSRRVRIEVEEEYLVFLDQRNQAKIQWIQDPS